MVKETLWWPVNDRAAPQYKKWVYAKPNAYVGYLQAKLVENNQTLDVDAENKMIVDRMENMRSTVLEKLGDLTDSLEQLH